MDTNARGDHPSESGSGRGGGGSAVSTTLTGPPSSDAEHATDSGNCEFYPSGGLPRECWEPRSCYDCLNSRIKDHRGGGCMVDTTGQCTSLNPKYRPERDFRVIENSTGEAMVSPVDGLIFFPAVNTTYCDPDDDACWQCRAESPRVAGATNRVPFRLGRRGCVCLPACEAPRPINISQSHLCQSASSPSPPSMAPRPIDRGPHYRSSSAPIDAAAQEQSHRRGRFWLISSALLGGLAAILIVVLWMQYFRRRRRRPIIRARTASGDRHDLVQGRGLNLFGWQAMRQALIEQEQRRLAGLDPEGAPPVPIYVELMDVLPSAPEANVVFPESQYSAPVEHCGETTTPSAPRYESEDDAGGGVP